MVIVDFRDKLLFEQGDVRPEIVAWKGCYLISSCNFGSTFKLKIFSSIRWMKEWMQQAHSDSNKCKEPNRLTSKISHGAFRMRQQNHCNIHNELRFQLAIWFLLWGTDEPSARKWAWANNGLYLVACSIWQDRGALRRWNLPKEWPIQPLHPMQPCPPLFSAKLLDVILNSSDS